MRHEIQVIFNGVQILDSPFHLLSEPLPPAVAAKLSGEPVSGSGSGLGSEITSGTGGASVSTTSEDYTIIEGGPLEGVQCGEKMWIILDPQTAPYTDAQFLVNGKFFFLTNSAANFGNFTLFIV
jgi:hypothetical protein